MDYVYSEQRRPTSDYPNKLAKFLKSELKLDNKNKLVDLGCGRGDMLRAFDSIGFEVTGIDISPKVKEHCDPLKAYSLDILKSPLPFDDNSFDIVFSKSVIEHLENPLPYLEKALSLLKPGGKLIVLTPSWLHHGWGPFYLDHTHVTPFTGPSLIDTLKIAGFEDIEVKHFRQLPFLWTFKWLTPFVSIFSKLPLPYSPMYLTKFKWPRLVNNFIRFSKEVMLLSYATKN